MAEKTRMTAEWAARVWNDNPCTKLENGNIRFLARTAFVQVLESRKDKKTGADKGYGLVAMLPDLASLGGPEVALRPMMDDYNALMKENAPLALTNPDLAAKYHNPFKKQGTWIDKNTGQLYDGFVPGRLAISANSPKSKPPLVDINGAPIVDKAMFYSGCWALVCVKAGWIKNDENPGVTFYLQSVMKVADDENLGGVGSPDPNQDFKGVKVDPTVNPAAAFGASGVTAGDAGRTAAAASLFS